MKGKALLILASVVLTVGCSKEPETPAPEAPVPAPSRKTPSGTSSYRSSAATERAVPATTVVVPENEPRRTKQLPNPFDNVLYGVGEEVLVPEYDARGDLIAIRAEGVEERMVRDEAGRLVAHLGIDGRETRFEYDEQGRLAAAIDPAGRTTYTRDFEGRIVRIETPGKRTWSFSFRRGQLAGMDGPMGPLGVQTNSRVTKVKDASGRLYVIGKSRGRLNAFSGGGQWVSGRFDDLGRVTRTESDTGTLRYSYSADGLTRVESSIGETLSYRLDAEAGTQELTTPWGVITRTFDARGQLERIETAGGTFRFEYDRRGQRTGLVYPNGLRATTRRDRLGRVVGFSVPGVLELETGFDRRHERAFVRRDGVEERYAFDSVGRLAHYERQGRRATFSYDSDGNRLKEVRPDGTRIPGTFDDRGRLVRLGDQVLRYDRGGRLVKRGRDTFDYDSFGRLIEVARADRPTVTYTYDAMGRLGTRTVSGRTTRYVWEGLRILAEVGPGSRRRVYVHGPELDEPLAYVEGGRWTYLHQGPRGHVLAYSDAQGKRAGRADFTPFGRVRETPGEQRPMFYAGCLRDPVAGLVLMRARAYDPELGRFLTADPSGLLGGLNAYVYVGNNPLDYTDPFGLRGKANSPLTFILGSKGRRTLEQTIRKTRREKRRIKRKVYRAADEAYTEALPLLDPAARQEAIGKPSANVLKAFTAATAGKQAGGVGNVLLILPDMLDDGVKTNVIYETLGRDNEHVRRVYDGVGNSVRKNSKAALESLNELKTQVWQHAMAGDPVGAYRVIWNAGRVDDLPEVYAERILDAKEKIEKAISIYEEEGEWTPESTELFSEGAADVAQILAEVLSGRGALRKIRRKGTSNVAKGRKGTGKGPSEIATNQKGSRKGPSRKRGKGTKRRSNNDSPTEGTKVPRSTRKAENGGPVQEVDGATQRVDDLFGNETKRGRGRGRKAQRDKTTGDEPNKDNGKRGDLPASTPVGGKGKPLNVPDGTNTPSTIGGREFSGHALDRMQRQGIPPSAVENTIRKGGTPGKRPGTTAHFDSENNITVITDTASGRVVTVDYGQIRQ